MNSHSNGTPSKNALTPRIRIGLSRNRKATNKEFKSPMLQKELIISPSECVSNHDKRLHRICEPSISDCTLSTNKATNSSDIRNEESSYVSDETNSVHTTPVLQSKKRKRHLLRSLSNEYNQESTSPAERVPEDHNLRTSELRNDSTNSCQIYAKQVDCNRKNETESICTTPVPQSKKKCRLLKPKSCDFKSSMLQEHIVSSADAKKGNQDVCKVVLKDCTSTSKTLEIYSDDTRYVEETDSICTTPILYSKKRGLIKQFHPDENKLINQNDFLNESKNKDVKQIPVISKSAAVESTEVFEERTINDVLQHSNLENNKKHFDEIKTSKDNIDSDATLDETSSKSKISKSVKRKLSLKLSSNSSNSDMIDSDEEFNLSLSVMRNKLRGTTSDKLKTVNMSPKFKPEASHSNENNLSQDEPLENYSSADLIEKILKLEDVVKDKKDKLDKLQQVSKYKNLHNVSNLKETTATWKNGCQDALRDLLMKLREHKHIDMPQLLANMKIPKSMITFDVETDCFL